MNPAAFSVSPSSRRWSSPCDEASSASRVQPNLASSAAQRATSAASGVVRPGGVSGSTSAPRCSWTPSVPMLAETWPSAAKIWRQKVATEVLPLVPVTATTTAGSAP